MSLHSLLSTAPGARPAGAAASADPLARPADTPIVAIQGETVSTTSPEGKSATMPLETFLSKVAPRRMDTAGAVLPDGIKVCLSRGPVTLWIYERPPCVERFRWIAPDSPVPFGRGTTYRLVRLALPYLIVVAGFVDDGAGNLQLGSFNECFFRTTPLKTLEDPLYYPALLNCSRFEPPAGRPLSWICTQYLKPTLAMRDPDVSKRMTAGFEALRHCLLETGYNMSSEHHEFSSWFTESRKIDPRLQSVEAWEAASTEHPLFVLDVPWLPTNHTLRQVADRIFQNQQAHAKAASAATAAALARIVFNHK